MWPMGQALAGLLQTEPPDFDHLVGGRGFGRGAPEGGTDLVRSRQKRERLSVGWGRHVS